MMHYNYCTPNYYLEILEYQITSGIRIPITGVISSELLAKFTKHQQVKGPVVCQSDIKKGLEKNNNNNKTFQSAHLSFHILYWDSLLKLACSFVEFEAISSNNNAAGILVWSGSCPFSSAKQKINTFNNYHTLQQILLI